MMTDRTDPAETLHDDRKLPVGATLDKLLETTKFHDMQTRLMHVVVLVNQEGDLSVPLDTCHRINCDTT
jgi:hypothetical protein